MLSRLYDPPQSILRSRVVTDPEYDDTKSFVDVAQDVNVESSNSMENIVWSLSGVYGDPLKDLNKFEDIADGAN